MRFKNLFLELDVTYWIRPKMSALSEECILFLDKCPFVYIRGLKDHFSDQTGWTRVNLNPTECLFVLFFQVYRLSREIDLEP